MEVLGICGSPRKKGNTIALMEALMKGTGKPYEILWACDMKIGHCTGCFKCKTETPGKCWQRDDMDMAIDKWLSAKAFVVGSPTYFGNVPGPLKNFIDRSIVTCNMGVGETFEQIADHGMRPFHGMPGAIISIAGGGDMEKTAANIRLVLDYYSLVTVGEFVEGLGNVDVREHPDILKEAEAIGQKMAPKMTVTPYEKFGIESYI